MRLVYFLFALSITGILGQHTGPLHGQDFSVCNGPPASPAGSKWSAITYFSIVTHMEPFRREYVITESKTNKYTCIYGREDRGGDTDIKATGIDVWRGGELLWRVRGTVVDGVENEKRKYGKLGLWLWNKIEGQMKGFWKRRSGGGRWWSRGEKQGGNTPLSIHNTCIHVRELDRKALCLYPSIRYVFWLTDNKYKI